jgi:hypothetical protein
LWQAVVTILVHDAAHSPVANATVSGSWSAGDSGPAICATDASGMCSVMSAQLPKSTGAITFQVTGVTHAALTYDPTDNHDADGDSDGTSIVVNKP